MRVQCTKKSPWDGISTEPVEHVDADETGLEDNVWPYGYYLRIACPNCNHRWWEEQPD